MMLLEIPFALVGEVDYSLSGMSEVLGCVIGEDGNLTDSWDFHPLGKVRLGTGRSNVIEVILEKEDKSVLLGWITFKNESSLKLFMNWVETVGIKEFWEVFFGVFKRKIEDIYHVLAVKKDEGPY